MGRRQVFVLAAKPRFERLASNDLADRSNFDASPAVAGSRLLIRSDKFLYCVGPSWSSTVPSPTAYNPDPPDGSNEVTPTPTLTWLPGQMATKHQVYFSNSLAAISQGAAEANKGATNQAAFAPGDLELAAVYFCAG